ncbi:MAG: hypothetical protein P8080_06080 [Gammaproteobacteria bacterium]
MTSRDIYELFTDALDTINKSLKENRGSGFYGTLISAWDKFVDGHKAGVAVYDKKPDEPFDYFTLRYLNGKFELLARGKSEHDTEWHVSRDYLESLADHPQEYIDNPAKLDLDWLKSKLPESAQQMLKKAS